jgi:hypothetical protein
MGRKAGGWSSTRTDANGKLSCQSSQGVVVTVAEDHINCEKLEKD